MSANAEKANRQYTCEYTFDGSRWGVEVWAATFEEAEMKLKAMGKGKVSGELKGIIPANGRCPTCGRSKSGIDPMWGGDE